MDVKKLISEMTLVEKASLCSGNDFWHTKPIERLKIPNIMLSDGPHGIRKQELLGDNLGIYNSIKAVCFPTACATASSFDCELMYELGEILAIECQSENIGVILGPAINIKRSPLCGRNFEYISEDPYLSSQMASSYIKGIQSKNIGTCPKHFIANNQETRRMTSSSEIDERTLREIYLASFEKAVIDAKPWTVMCSYNKVNGIQISESKRFLNDILRDEWNFDGCVVSDWGAVKDRVKGLEAGLDLEMPSSNGLRDELIVKAVKEGKLDINTLNKAVERILNLIYKLEENKNTNTLYDKELHHKIARKIESESIILLKNDNILPLDSESKTAFIGLFAENPRYQGGGSSHINSFKVESALDAVKSKQEIFYAKGYNIDDDIIDDKLINEAVKLASNVDTAVIFAGLPDSFESEGYDRKHMRLPECQNTLIESVSKVQPNTIVILHNGSPVEMPWINNVKGIIEVYLGGEAVGGATIDVLYGDVNPSGKLAETFPIKLEDNPSYIFYGGEKDKVEYREGIFVGYRYYDKKNAEVLFPFGYGLSYTTFEYSNLRLDKKSMKDTETLKVCVDISNIGKVFGKEVVQLYIEDLESTVIKPIRELKGFTKVALNPGETKTVKFELSKGDFSYYNIEINDWYVESGEFNIAIGKSSRDIVCREKIFIESTVSIPVIYDENSTIGDILSNPESVIKLKALFDKYASKNEFTSISKEYASLESLSQELIEETINSIPLRQLIVFLGGVFTYDDLNEVIKLLNE